MRKMILTLILCSLLVLPVHAAAPTVALTFDDGPSGDLTERLLDGLRARGVRATFFVCGYRVAQYPRTLCRIAQEGHEVGLHSCCHDYMHKMSREAVYDDLVSCMEAVTECCGVAPRLFRPPGGLYDEAVCTLAGELDLSIALWSVDPEDWNHRTQAQIVSSILSQAGDGDVVLMHDIFPASRAAALEIVDALQARGYALVTLSTLAAIKGAAAEAGAVYSCFG